MCRHCDTVICSPMLCEWLLYCSCVFTLIQSLKEQIEAKEEVLSFNIETQKQMQTTIDGLTKTEETNNRTVQELREKQKQLQATIDDQTKTQKANKRTVQELREKQKQLQATIDELIKTMEPDVSTRNIEAVTTSKWSENLPSINVVKFGTNTDVS